ncbi:MAG: hypothetical protein WBA92_04665 [Pseudorhodobacter sp.]
MAGREQTVVRLLGDNNQRYHASLNNVAPADGYFGLGKAIRLGVERVKEQVTQKRCLQQKKAGQSRTQTHQYAQCSSGSDVSFYGTTERGRASYSGRRMSS